jgi:hypothetical protein
VNVRQLSISIENKASRQTEVSEVAAANVGIRDLSVSDAVGLGTVRPIVDDPERGRDALGASFTARMSDVLCIDQSDDPAKLASVLRTASVAGGQHRVRTCLL